MKRKPKYTDREIATYTARVYLREATSRRHDRAFHATLLQWAANARKRAATERTTLF
jgi:hypothetical protein